MKYLKTYPEKCSGCKTCMLTCSKAYFKEENEDKSRIKIKSEDSNYKIIVCTQCGACVNECPTQALTINKQGVIMLNKKLCINCLACVAVCPENAMFYVHDDLTPFKCIACGLCVKACPNQALELVKEGE